MTLFIASAAHAASFQGIGFIDTSTPVSQSMGVSSDGSVVFGGSQALNTTTTPMPNFRAARWTAAGIEDLGYWPDRTGNDHIPVPHGSDPAPAGSNPRYIRSLAFGSSSDGVAAPVEVQISSVHLPADETSGTRAGVYTTTLGMQDIIGKMNPSTPGNVAGNNRNTDYTGNSFTRGISGLSGVGSVVVGWGVAPAASPFQSSDQAYKWTRTGDTAGTLQGLGYLSNATGRFSYAQSVSGDGTVVGGSSDGAGDTRRRAVIWNSGGAVNLGQIGTTGTVSEIFGLNTDGTVGVGFGTNSAGVIEAFRWDAANHTGPDTGFTLLGFLDDTPGFRRSDAVAVSGDGTTIVGRSWVGGTSSAHFRAFLWKDGVMNRLDTYLTDLGLGSALAGWELRHATGISADGLKIVGFGLNPQGQTEGYIAVIPEPASFSLLALGGAMLLRRNRRQ